MGLIGRLVRRRETRAAERRFRASNQAAEVRGCRCGQPATHIRYGYGQVGRVPFEIYSCAEHVNVNGWHSSDGVCWTPTDDYDQAALAWVSEPFLAHGAQLR